MCSYNLKLDNQLVAEAQSSLALTTEASFQMWLQQEVESLLREQVSGKRGRANRRRHQLSDEQLAGVLANNKPLCDSDFPELSTEDYAAHFRSSSGKLIKGLDKWL